MEVAPGIHRIESVLGPRPFSQYLLRGERTLRILGIWFEEGFSPMEEPAFIPALGKALDAYRSFVGAASVSWPRTRPGRDIAGGLRRIGR